ncbi:hypothetical protein CDAR_40011 [Caerostris darwini]|uniref:Uncharacterized protein n=1 Tax=Caerostris darwini TaxID=1538125 RepID=A0AAV4RCG4_9ARAC|nr:hypothetical protein CDAR_40011 [Caerostris darwini]
MRKEDTNKKSSPKTILLTFQESAQTTSASFATPSPSPKEESGGAASRRKTGAEFLAEQLSILWSCNCVRFRWQRGRGRNKTELKTRTFTSSGRT